MVRVCVRAAVQLRRLFLFRINDKRSQRKLDTIYGWVAHHARHRHQQARRNRPPGANLKNQSAALPLAGPESGRRPRVRTPLLVATSYEDAPFLVHDYPQQHRGQCHRSRAHGEHALHGVPARVEPHDAAGAFVIGTCNSGTGVACMSVQTDASAGGVEAAHKRQHHRRSTCVRARACAMCAGGVCAFIHARPSILSHTDVFSLTTPGLSAHPQRVATRQACSRP